MTRTAGVRSLAKRAVERTVVGTGLTALARRARRGEVVVLGYHNIVPDGEPIAGDRSLHLPQREFAAQLDILGETHDVIPLDAVLGRAERTARPAAVVTFDDGYRGAVTAGVAELARRGMPATMFVPPAFVGGGEFWWDALAVEGDRGAFRELALTVCRGEDAKVRAEAKRRGIATREVPAHARCATVEELRAAMRHIAIASHAWSHPNLAELPPDALGDELTRPLEWMIAELGAALPWLAYPYGRCSAHVEVAVRECGYAGALLIEGGWSARPPRDAHAIPRLDVPGEVSRDGFAMRIAGLVAG
ncbi:MAG: polysaccharide deacetylase family protein [Gemmatimonadaceae bacterium]|nr:polysaccharide deacetylase family protein [Gemmatimonadaceae bacterium]NUQ92160.1 polysaccharide deacetylase family protein [Gemmatimonadaceae bacterium]NUR18268.1 polysaccharide deacetylase family protein [Gemmatimonadaceae bacterium]NUS97080.1 polysaccharide deacetylase family protein [Gemmatimonadaceae bacterium]